MSAPGLRLETAASVILEDTIKKHFHTFAHVIQWDRASNKAVVAAYISGLAGACALTIKGRHASREEVEKLVLESFRAQLTEDLQHLG